MYIPWQRTDLRAMYAPAPSPRTTTCGILSSASTQIRPVPTSWYKTQEINQLKTRRVDMDPVHRRRIKKKKGKGRRSLLFGGKNLFNFFAAQAVLPIGRFERKGWIYPDQMILLFKIIQGKTASAPKELNKFSPPPKQKQRPCILLLYIQYDAVGPASFFLWFLNPI